MKDVMGYKKRALTFMSLVMFPVIKAQANERVGLLQSIKIC